MITQQRQSRVHLLNRVLDKMPTFPSDLGNKARANQLKLNEATYYAARKTLREMGRISKEDKVLSPRKITPEEYSKYGFPYGKDKKKTTRIVKGSKKKVAKKKPVHTARAATGAEILQSMREQNPRNWDADMQDMDFPIRSKPAPGKVTIEGTPDDLAAFFKNLK
jgi:hypothetical protein